MTELKVTAEPGSHEVSTEREIDAPRDLVFRAYKDPELLAQWLGPRKYSMEIDTFEFRDGRIAAHVDRFSFWRWSRQALGASGLLLGWTPIIQGAVRRQARAGLDKFLSARERVPGTH